MLLIDDNLLKLAKMLESLLKVDTSSRDINLKKYKDIVIEIDSKTYDSFLDEIKQINLYNHTLEDELKILEKLKDTYNQLNELQCNFKNVCELYNDDLKLSDLTVINIDYIDNRINVINGYLINVKNIENNKKLIQELNEELINEEKKKNFLDNKLLELERILKDNFISAEGRLLVDGRLQYTSILSEYSGLGFDANELLNDSKLLEKCLSEYNKRRVELSESVKAAEICYNSLLTVDSKQVLNEIKNEDILIKYKLTILKILKILSKNCNEYEEFIDKREKIIDLIKYRLVCMNELGIKMSIDPFDRIKLKEQLEEILSIANNSKTISKLMKKISDLNSRTEEMVAKNSEYLKSLSEIEDLLINKMSFGDVDITTLDEYNFEDMLMKREVVDNQVVSVKDVSSKFNMNVVNQKTTSVIKRVNQMMVKKNIIQKKEKSSTFTPELVIVPKKEDVLDSNLFIDEVIGTKVESIPEAIFEEKQFSKPIEVVDITNIDNDMFETIVPFEEPILFMDRTDEVVSSKQKIGNEELMNDQLFSIPKKEVDLQLNYELEKKNNDNMELYYGDIQEQLPDAFWVVQDNNVSNETNFVSSFDDQINKLLTTNVEDSKTRKKVA